MQAVVIYDNQGHIWNVTYGDGVLPEAVSAARMEIPDGSQLTGVDLTDPANPAPKYENIPALDYAKLQAQIEELQEQLQRQQESNAEMASELLNAQMALTELYEGMEG